MNPSTLNPQLSTSCGSRHGKIASFPRALRDQLNQRLADGQHGVALLQWLNELPEVKAVLAAHYAGQSVSAQNLSVWRHGGYQDWCQQQETAQLMRTMAEEDDSLHTIDQEILADRSSLWLTARYLLIGRKLAREANSLGFPELGIFGLADDYQTAAEQGVFYDPLTKKTFYLKRNPDGTVQTVPSLADLESPAAPVPTSNPSSCSSSSSDPSPSSSPEPSSPGSIQDDSLGFKPHENSADPAQVADSQFPPPPLDPGVRPPARKPEKFYLTPILRPPELR